MGKNQCAYGAVTSDGLSPTTDGNSIPMDWTYIAPGHGIGANTFSYGYVKEVRIYPSAYNNTQLQAITTP